MKKIRLGVIGTGLAFVDLHWPVLQDAMGSFEISMVASRTEEKAEKTAEMIRAKSGSRVLWTSDYRAVLDNSEVDAVLIAVPIHRTPTIAKAALEHGKHVFAEKPLSDNVIDAESIIKSAEQLNRVLLVGENFRYQRQFYQLNELLRSGAVGKPLVYRLNDMHFTPATGKYAVTAWRQEGLHKGGYLVDGGSHIVAGMRIAIGERIVRVCALTTSFNPLLSSQQADAMLLNLLFESGMIGQMALGYGAVDRDARRPKIYGTDGTMILFSDRIEILKPSGDTSTVQIEQNGPGFKEEWADFSSAITAGRPLLHSPRESLADLAVIEAGLRSASTGAAINLP